VRLAHPNLPFQFDLAGDRTLRAVRSRIVFLIPSRSHGCLGRTIRLVVSLFTDLVSELQDVRLQLLFSQRLDVVGKQILRAFGLFLFRRLLVHFGTRLNCLQVVLFFLIQSCMF
jgi:hypothetical protein